MSVENVIVAKVGERANPLTGRNMFCFNRNYYKLLLDIDIQRVIKDIHTVTAFTLQSLNDGQTLWLTFAPALLRQEERFVGYLRSTERLVETFFIIEREHLFNEIDDENNAIINGNATDDELPPTIIDDLYRHLRDDRQANLVNNNTLNNSQTEKFIQHEHLRPTLKPYQIDGVKWMLNRECIPEYLPSEFKEVKRRWTDQSNYSDDETFLYNARTYILKTGQNVGIPIPSGGILADAMGLGKTVEMLDLILLNPRELAMDVDKFAKNDDTAKKENGGKAEIRCTCIDKGRNRTVSCIRCRTLQHRKCVSQYLSPDEQYICPLCWKHEEPFKAKTTFIVSPTSIKMQWKDECDKHIDDDNFKILIYNGFKKNGWTNPVELASYDVILTDYLTLQQEFTYSDRDPTTHKLRHPPQYIYPKSPLLHVNWWRVCLDEAQMVSSVVTKPSKLVSKLSAVHRWAVTGTPIQSKIDELYGLIRFLGYSPYNEREKWLTVVDDFNYEGNIKPLLAALQPIMWRTCKSEEIMQQTDIPIQTELMMEVNMSELEQYHYNEEHARVFEEFRANALRIGEKTRLTALFSHTLTILMEPLRRLRQDCTIPSVTDKRLQKQTLKPTELLNHLITTTENDANKQLQTITSSLNGIGDIYMIKNEIANAIEEYKSVLKWTEDHHQRNKVDLLCQIHAIHNLLLVDQTITKVNRMCFESRQTKLELEYLRIGSDVVQKLLAEQENSTKGVEGIQSKLHVNAHQWWKNALENEKNPDQLVRTINCAVCKLYPSCDESLETIEGISMVLTKWLEKVFEQRKHVQKQFNELRPYMNYFKPMAELQAEEREKMELFLNHASNCHSTDSKRAAKRMKIEKCKLCMAKHFVGAYESVIFNKNPEGNYQLGLDAKNQKKLKPAYQECVLRTIQRHIPSGIDKENGKNFIAVLNGISLEFKVRIRRSKAYKKLLTQAIEAVSAYQQIDSCKMRLKTVDPAECHQWYKNSFIPTAEVDNKMAELKRQEQEAKIIFAQKLGHLKYFNQLQKNGDLDDCPICCSSPRPKYVMFECGHHLCNPCFIKWEKTSKATGLICVTCRHPLSEKNSFVVSVPDANRITDSSSKIEMIVQKVHDLKRAEANVKIVIFSQWTSNLTAIEAALISTNITYRSDTCQFHKTIMEFKDPCLNVTCLLLPLTYGSKGLNLVEATHVFLVEPILNPGEELQAIGRIHRIGQTRKTYVHRFIVKNTIEEAIHMAIMNDKNGLWSSQKCTVESLIELFAPVK